MLRPSDNVVLKLGGKQVELLAEAGNANSQIIVAFGMFLGINEGLGIGYVELNVAKSVFAGGDENIGHGIDVSVAEKLGVYFYNSRGGAGGFFSRQLGDGVKQCSQTVKVTTLHGGAAIGNRLARTSAVGRGNAMSAVVDHP